MDPLNDEAFFDDPILFPGSREGQTQTWLRGKDTPWTPFGDAAGISPIDVNAQTPDFITNCSNPSAFLDYRSAGIRSECETVPGDSGYGSMVFDNTSHYDEPFSNIPVQNLDQDIPEFKQISLGQPADHLYSQGGSQGGYLNPSSASEKKLFCQGCNTWVKTNSELKKHELRHTKPYRCNAGDCATKDRGFASQNDLTRHQMTVHRNHELGKTYYCDVGECARRSKPWPRADNFRSHLQRVHKLEVLADADLSRYLHNQSRDQHPITEDLSGIGTQLQETSNTSVQHAADPNYSPQDPIKDFPDIDTQPTPHQLRAANQASIQDLISPNSQTVYSQSSVLEPGFEKYPFGNSLASVQPQSHSLLQHQTPRDLPKMEAVTPSHDNTSISQDVTEMDAESDDISVSDDDLDIKRIQDSSLMKAASAGDRKTLLEALRKLPPRLLQEALDNTPGFEANADAASTSSKGGNKSHCNQCTKSFKRPCELRKHMKRHERPYGCTVRRCPKTFGSKNDWKRHERGQHNQAEVWSCDLDCSYFSYQRDELNSHLRVYHKLSNDRVINEKLDNNRRGGHCIDEFWCGFCRALVKMDLAKVGATETEESKSSIIDQRFNHIDHHFMGRDGGPRLDISHWCHPEDFFEKLLQPKRQAEHSRKRKGNQAHANPRPAKQVNTMTA